MFGSLRRSIGEQGGGWFIAMLAFASFTLIYTSLWDFVGRFPAESMEVSQADARSVHSICYDAKDTRQMISIPFPKLRGADAMWLHVQTKPISDGQLGQLSSSRALFYSVYDRNIYLMNTMDPADVTKLIDLSYWGILDRKAVDQVIAKSPAFSPPCTAPPTDQGLTEAYWGTKGTSVLHHWAFLYDASFSDGKPVHGQYGFVVSRLARWITLLLGSPGPTMFVRVAWGLFWFAGICYSFAFLYVFRNNLGLAATGLAWQIASFASVGPFGILCAPGYHWSREVVMVMPALLLAIFSGRSRVNRGIVASLAIVFIALGYAIDPSFTIVATGCLTLALAVRYWRAIRNTVRNRPTLVIAASLFLLVAIGVGLVIDGSNVIYAFSKTIGFAGAALANPAHNLELDVNIAAAIVCILLCAWQRLPIVAAYYGLISIVSFEFFVVTPDSFHWAKYTEFVVPIYVVLAIASVSYFARFRLFPRVRPFIGAALAIVSVVLFSQSYQSVNAMPTDWELRVVDSVGAQYFSSAPVTINNRLLDANVNDDTVNRLRAFPSKVRTDFILSPLDKYVLFLYDEHNGFSSSVDATAWLDDDGRLLQTENTFSARKATILIDSQVYRVNPLAGLLSTNGVIGSDNSQSVLIEKARIRMNELAAYVIEHCAVQPAEPGGRWNVAHC